MKDWIKSKLLGDKSTTLDEKRKSRLDSAVDEATDGTAKPPKKYAAGGAVRGDGMAKRGKTRGKVC